MIISGFFGKIASSCEIWGVFFSNCGNSFLSNIVQFCSGGEFLFFLGDQKFWHGGFYGFYIEFFHIALVKKGRVSKIFLVTRDWQKFSPFFAHMEWECLQKSSIDFFSLQKLSFGLLYSRKCTKMRHIIGELHSIIFKEIVSKSAKTILIPQSVSFWRR